MNFLRELKWSIILIAIGFIALGIVMILWPEATMTTICYILAALLIMVGVVFLVNYLSKDIVGILYRHDLVVGVSAILGGVLIIVKVEQLTNLIPVVLGFVVTISGILKLQNSVDMLRLGHGTWHVAFALAIINVVAGVVLLINPFAKEMLILSIGICLVYSGLTDLYVTIAISRRLRKIEKVDE